MPRKSGLRTQRSSRECARSTSSSIRRLQDVAVGSKDEGTHRDSCADDALQGDPLWRALVTPGSMAEIKKWDTRPSSTSDYPTSQGQISKAKRRPRGFPNQFYPSTVQWSDAGPGSRR